MKKIILLIGLLLLFMGNLYATRYYVNYDGGSDDSLGTSPSAAWKTLTRVNATNFSNDDTISFKCGQRFTGIPLKPLSSGTLGHPIVFNNYGTGARPVIDRNGDNPNFWRACSTGNVFPAFDTCDYGGLCVDLITHSRNYITFNGIKFVRGFRGNVAIWSCNYITFESCNLDSAFQTYYTSAAPGMIYAGGGYGNPTTHLTIRNSTLKFSRYGHGGYFDPVHQLLLEYDTIAFNGANGFQTYSAYIDSANPDVCYQDTVRYCIIKQNDLVNKYEYQILDNSSQKSAFYYNIIEANNTSGSNSTCIRINNDYNTPPRQVGWYNNTIIMHGTGEALDWGPNNTSGIDSISIKNNIVYLDNIAQTGMWFYAQAGMNNVIINNLYYYPSGGAHLFHFGPVNGGTNYPTIANWKTASNTFTTPNGGYESNSKAADPLFTLADSIFTLKDSSSAVLAGVGVGLTQDITGKTVADPPDIGAYQNSTYWYGPQSNNQTMSGNAAVIGDLTLSGSGTFTISPGTHIRVKNTYNINFNGKLYCQGSQQNKIIFDPLVANNNWGTITLGAIVNGSTANGSTIKYTNINNCNEIDIINTSNDTIQNCNIINSSMHGMYFSGGTGCSVSNDTIKNSNTAHGIYVTNSANITCTGNVVKRNNLNHNGVGIFFGGGGTGLAAKNDIRGFDWGIGSIWGSSPNSWTGNHSQKNNRISNCNVALEVYKVSYPNFGYPSYYDSCGGNSFDSSNTKNAEVGMTYYSDSCGLNACFDWWGSYPPNTSKFDKGANAYFNYQLPASYDLWAGIPLPKIVAGGGTLNSIDSLFIGTSLFRNNKFIEAKDYYISYLKQHPDNQAAYTYLYGCANSNTISEVINFFKTLPSGASRELKLLLSYLYLQQGSIDLAKKVNEDIISENPNTPLAVRAILNNFYIALYNDNDVKAATDLLNVVKTQASLSTPMEISTAEDALMVRSSVLSTELKSILTKPMAYTDKPTSYSISQNYPNPFNPSTTIRYQITKPGLVTLKVYDILGREIATLVNENKIEGSYNYLFNASKFASGVYIYQIRVNDYVSSKKMILLK
jgi:tetratricopeptide (TPR) repeat protein